MNNDPQDTSPLAAAPSDPVPATPAVARFLSCRWHEPAAAPVTAHCTHREVRPIAGVGGFSPEAWCPECPHYKVRRTPRKAAFNQ